MFNYTINFLPSVFRIFVVIIYVLSFCCYYNFRGVADLLVLLPSPRFIFLMYCLYILLKLYIKTYRYIASPSLSPRSSILFIVIVLPSHHRHGFLFVCRVFYSYRFYWHIRIVRLYVSKIL